MRYAKIRNMDVSNGDGICCSLFIQGCPHHCKGCFNVETWDYNNGKEFTKELQDKFISLCNNPYIDHISILGGEPLSQSNEFYNYLKKVKQEVDKPMWLWTGYTYEELNKFQLDVINTCVDILVDGRFIEELKDLNLKHRGSSNQRVIDVKQSIIQNKIITID